MPRPLRSSCDRCHAQKLKCPKEPGTATCLRCRKAGSSCVFSPAGPAWRRPSAHGAYQTAAVPQRNTQGDVPLDFDLPWPSLLDNGDLPAMNIEYIPPPLSDPTPEPTTRQDPRSICVRRLSAIAAEIHDVAVEIAPAAALHLAKEGNLEEFYAQHVIHVSHARCIEQVFTLAQRLMDLYPDLLRILPSKQGLSADGGCSDLDCCHNYDIAEEFADIFVEADPTHGPIDSFLLNLLAACHGKISDVLDYIISATKFCAKVTAASPDLIQPRLHIPEFRIGSFVASETSAPTMHATLFAHIASVLGENAKRLRKTVEDASKETDSPDKAMKMMLLQCELLEERSETQAVQFTRIRDGLTRYAYTKQSTN